ncbi:unnamed protein product [Effrenium voratum]|uniref:DNA (cytosine-5-)-methyltransferase n=1 Tax=Effrenium voratum TaxID=2562239 RepID=A0AA36MPE9_9DINO|nr:unnamed protein product [Effrenium voratum]CAJ1453740.1 unnamed protein product [Effrenium voratum]
MDDLEFDNHACAATGKPRATTGKPRAARPKAKAQAGGERRKAGIRAVKKILKKKTSGKQQKAKPTTTRQASSSSLQNMVATKFLQELGALASKLAAEEREGGSSFARAELRRGRTILLGSDCAGLGSDLVSLVMSLDTASAKTKFVAEADQGKLQWLRAISAHLADETPELEYQDITTRDNRLAPRVHLFVSGAPCPPFSSAGKRGGLSDDRGWLILHSLSYVVWQRPMVAVFENVKGLANARNKALLDAIVKILKDCGYKVYADILNTQEHGLPQSRPRVYVVAMLKDYILPTRKFSFPEPIAMPSLERCLDHQKELPDSNMPDQASGKSAIRNIRKARGRLLAKGSDDVPSSEEVVVDTGCGKNFFSMMIGRSPCLTKARGGQGGYYLLKRKRHMTIYEMGAIQGWDKSWVDILLEANSSCKKLGKAFGDGMSLNVLQRLLPRALYTVNLVNKLPEDHWKNMPKSGRLPRAVYKQKLRRR